MKLIPKFKAKGKNHLIFVVGAAMSLGLIYLFTAPKLVKPAAPMAAMPVASIGGNATPGGLMGGSYSGALAHAYRGHGGHRDDSFFAARGHGGHRGDDAFLAHAYAVRDTSISDVYPWKMRLSGGV